MSERRIFKKVKAVIGEIEGSKDEKMKKMAKENRIMEEGK